MVVISVIIAKSALRKDRIDLPAATAAKHLIIQLNTFILTVAAAMVANGYLPRPGLFHLLF
jgi:hypothetical protein